MHFKKCGKCLQDKNLSEYYIRKSGPRSGKYYEKCKKCMKERGRKYYHLNRKRQLRLALLRRGKSRELMRRFLASVKNKPCMDCGKIYPYYVMDFDHRENEEKVTDVTRMALGGWSKIKITNEINKCDLVCANCHRIRTYTRNHAEVAKVVTAEL